MRITYHMYSSKVGLASKSGASKHGKFLALARSAKLPRSFCSLHFCPPGLPPEGSFLVWYTYLNSFALIRLGQMEVVCIAHLSEPPRPNNTLQQPEGGVFWVCDHPLFHLM